MGVSRPTLYQVVMPNVSGNTNDYLRFYCKATFIPEKRVERISAVGHDSLGVERQQGTRVVYGKPFEITVIENSEFSIYRELSGWFDQVASNTNNRSGGGGPSRGMRMAYYDDIVRDISLFKLENPRNAGSGLRAAAEERRVLEVIFRNAFPVRMGRVTLGSDLFDSYTEFTAAFTYETFSYE